MLARKEKKVEMESLDKEWVDLIKTAKGLGMTPEQVRAFFQKVRIPASK